MEALLLTREEIVEWLKGAGWWVATWDDEGALVGHYDDLLILAHESEIGTMDPTFELYDGARGLNLGPGDTAPPSRRATARAARRTPRKRARPSLKW